MDELVREYITFARQLSTSGCYSKSFDYYLLAFDKCADIKPTHEPEFRMAMTRLNEVLISANKMENIFNNFNRAMEAFPNNIHFLNDIGKYLFKYAFYEEAWLHFQKALKIDSGFVNAEKNLNSVKNLLVERWHFRMLNDSIRNEAYRQAINQTVRCLQDTVLDIGTGTGLLAMYAHACTPRSVLACDGSQAMAKLAEAITDVNQCQEVIVVNKMSTDMNYKDIGGKRSLILTEMFDAGLFGEHVLETLSHAWVTLMIEFARVIPEQAEFYIVGANSKFLNRKYQLCSYSKTLLNIQELNVHIINHMDPYDCEDVHLYGDDIKYMTEPCPVMKINFNKPWDILNTIERSDPYNVALNASSDGEINTYIGWFNLYLNESVTVTTNPLSSTRANAWQQAVFFDSMVKEVKQTDIIDLKFLVDGGKLTMLPEKNCPITRISPETLRFLNDLEYMKMIMGCIGTASVYLGQMAEISQINIIDLSPFPMFGLQLLKRGIQSLICCAKTYNDMYFFKRVFKANDIPLSKVTILTGTNWSQEEFQDEKYHAVFCNIFELCGEIDLRLKEIAQHVKQNHLLQGGLFLPANIKLMGQIVHSHWLEINNRVFDKYASDYKVAEFINKYQVSQNFFIDLHHLKYTALSEPCLLGTWNGPIGTEVVSVPVIKDGRATALLCWYHIELMEDLNEISTNRKYSFMDGMAFICNRKTRLRNGQHASLLRCVDADGSFKIMVMNSS